MGSNIFNLFELKEFTDTEFTDFCKFIYDNAGINLTEKKRSLVNNRLRKRVIHHNFKSYGDYFRMVKATPSGEEFITMINCITTNVSSFFRDAKQIKVLTDYVIPSIFEKNPNKKLKIWSAGCSTGEEPYSLTIQILNWKANTKFEIYSTDISTKVLQEAQQGIYKQEQLKVVEEMKLIKRFFINLGEDKYQVKPEVKKYIKFDKLNLISDPFPKNIDIIFCRNVIIYFDRSTKEKLFTKFYNSLSENGFLFLGHSESLFNNKLFKFYKPSIYKKVI